MKPSSTLFILFSTLPTLGLSQNLDTLLPPATPPVLDPEAVALALPEPGEARYSIAARPGEEIILERLRGVTLASDPALAPPLNRRDGVFNVDIAGLQETDIPDFVNQQLDSPVSRESLERLTYVLQTAMRNLGRPFTLVYAPPQDITDGHIVMVVQDSRVGAIRITGNRYFDEHSYRSRLALQPGQTIDLEQVQSSLARINANPYRQAQLTVAPGDEALTTDLILNVREARPLSFNISAHNQGNTATGSQRWAAGLDWGNVLGSAHRLSAQFSGDTGLENTRALSMHYQMDLPRAHGLQISAVYSSVESDLPAPLDQNGRSWQMAAQYNMPLSWQLAGASHTLGIGVDLKSSDNNLNFVAPPIVFPVTDTLTRIAQLRADYRATRSDSLGFTSASATWVLSPGQLVGHNNDAAFNASRSGATARYQYVRLRADRMFQWPSRPQLSWTLSATAQIAADNLLGSEQLSAGGFASVRGYDEGAIIGDEGVLFRQELLFDGLTSEFEMADSAMVFLFHDVALTRAAKPLPQERNFSIASAGVGIRLSTDWGLQLDAAYGWPVRESGSLPVDGSGKFHFYTRLTF